MNRPRSGAALIIAIVVLAALLLLGLPFLFTQSGSLSGTRSYAQGRLANVGQDSAQSMGIAAGASALSYRWQQGGVRQGANTFLDDWSDLFLDLDGKNPASGLRRIGINHLEVDTRSHTFALPGDTYLQGLPAAERAVLLQRYPTVVGLAIEDESGKLDPNHLDTRAWTALLAAVDIKDWTDGQIPVNDPGRMQLARVLGNLRYTLPGGRITALEQLLLAEPPLTVLGTSTPVPVPRLGLTRAELERLRPFLTLSLPAQARGGLIDLGTVIGVEAPTITLDSDQPKTMLAWPVAPLLVGAGTTLVMADARAGILTMPAFGETPQLPLAGAAAAIDAPPVLNLHQAEDVVRRSFAPGVLPPATPPLPPRTTPVPALLTELAQLALGGRDTDELGHRITPFDLQSPLAVTDRLGMTHVLWSQNGDDGAPGPYTDGKAQDGSGKPVLEATATVLHVKTGSLDRFPARGFAILEGTLADSMPDISASEMIEYQGSTPALPLTSGNAAGNPDVLLTGVRRGVDGTAKRFRAGRGGSIDGADLHLTALAAREQIPIGIASQGVISIASTATVTDPAGNQAAQDRHRVTAQALPQESPLEARWDKQATMHALLAQRHGSLMTTFPRPYPRLEGILPQDAASYTASVADGPLDTAYVPPADARDPDHAVGMRPAVLATLAGASHLTHDWKLLLGGPQAQALLPQVRADDQTWRPGSPPVAVSPTTYAAGDLTPEGLTLDHNRVLAYPNRKGDGLIPDAFSPGPNGSPGVLSPLTGRQFSLWVRPDATWVNQVALLDMRVPVANVGHGFDGTIDADGARDGRTVAENDVTCNRFSLLYDQTARQLILVLNPGVIPFTAPASDPTRIGFGPAIPRETYGTAAAGSAALPLKTGIYPAVNPECLGSGGANPMSCYSPITTIQHRYLLGAQEWQPGEWHQVQVSFSSNQPGGMAIIVDGLVGRDVARLRSVGGPAAMTQAGDHLTLPSLVLRQDLPAGVMSDGAQVLYVPRLKLDAWAPVSTGATGVTGATAVKSLLPKRGVVRIGNEYISYESIDDSDGSLLNCVRARRQRTDGNLNAAKQVPWGTAHHMEDHFDGDLVVPGGFAIRDIPAGTWYRGGCQLEERLPDGGYDTVSKRYRNWSVVASKTLQGVADLVLAGGTIYDFPKRGFIWLTLPTSSGGKLYFYDNTFGPNDTDPPATALHNLSWWSDAPIVDPMTGLTISPPGWRAGLETTILAGTDATVASIELSGDPTNAYEGGVVTSGPPADFVPIEGALEDYQGSLVKLVQLYDAHAGGVTPTGGRAEWLTYTCIDSRTDYPTSVPVAPGEPNQRMSFMLNLMLFHDVDNGVTEKRPGFWFDPEFRTGARGRQRTAFAPSDFKSYDATQRFPAKTRVIPVQRDIPIAYLLEAGDIVTLTPKTLKGGELPVQMCVRYSADDGYPESGSTPISWNVTNQFFAFTEPMPSGWNPGNLDFHLLCWPCWTPDEDLSLLNSGASWKPQRLGWLLPWGNAYVAGHQPTGDASERLLRLFTDGLRQGLLATVDALQGGAQLGWQQQTLGQDRNNPSGNTQAKIIEVDGVAIANGTPWMGAGPLTGPVSIRIDQPMFRTSYGIIDIGGETFAFKTNQTQDDADLKPDAVHPDPVQYNQAQLVGRSLLGSATYAHRGQELVLHLPIGPVAEITAWNQVEATKPFIKATISGDVSAPALLLCDRGGQQHELMRFANSYTAPWLRGMYNTTAQAWPDVGNGDFADTALAIGWWPRYPSGFPKRFNTAAAVGERSGMLRCRSYAWAGFPLRFHGCRFDSDRDLAEVTVLGDGDRLYDILALALDGTMDWSDAGTVPLVGDPLRGMRANASGAFNNGRFRVLGDEAINSRLTNPDENVRTVDGGELRVVWRYRDPAVAEPVPADWLLEAARNGASAPMLGPVKLRTRAANRVINVER